MANISHSFCCQLWGRFPKIKAMSVVNRAWGIDNIKSKTGMTTALRVLLTTERYRVACFFKGVRGKAVADGGNLKTALPHN